MGCHFAGLNRTPIVYNYLVLIGVLHLLNGVILGCTGLPQGVLHLMCCMDVYLEVVLLRNCYLCKNNKKYTVHNIIRWYRNKEHAHTNYYTSVVEMFSHLNCLYKRHCANMKSNRI